jgi:four helix bundle protein
LKERTKEFALRVVRLYASLPRSIIAQTLGKQVLRSGTSVGAHYREAVRSRSDAEYVSKIEGALQELEETSYWLELLADAGVCQSGSLTALRAEADELTAMLVTCAKKAKSRMRSEE